MALPIAMAWWGWTLIGIAWAACVVVVLILGAAAGDADDEMGAPRG